MEQLDNLVWIVYLIDVFCGDNDGVIILIALGACGWLFVKVGVVDTGCPWHTAALKLPNWPAYLIVSLMVLSNFIPSKDTAYKMLAIYGGVELLQQPEIQEVGGKGLDVLNKVMDDYLQEEYKSDEKD